MADNKTMINPNYRSNRRKVEEGEKELEALMAQASGEPEEEEQEEEVVKEEKVVEAKQEEEAEPTDPEEKTFKKRYGDLRRHMAEKEKQWEDRLKSLEKSEDRMAPPTSKENLEAWIKQYPEVAGFVEAIADKKAKALYSTAEERLKQLDEREYESKRKSAEQVITEAHSDFQKLKKSDAFHDWAESEPKWVRDALYENEDDPLSVIRVIDLYKMSQGLTPADKKGKTKEAAKAIDTSSKMKIDPEEGNKRFKESDIAKKSDKWYEANEEAIMESMRNGSFIYDMTGGAR